MESLNLNMLASSLPNSNLANAETELMNNFKAAAHSITTLYRSSRRTSKRAYNAGYAAACQDLLLMIQQGVSTSESSDPNSGGMSIGRIMDYIEARLEAIKSREEEEDEDEEKDRERDRERARQSATPTTTDPKSPARPTVEKSRQSVPAGTPRPKEQPAVSVPLTPSSPGSIPAQQIRLPLTPLSALTSSFSPLRSSSAPLPITALQQRKTRSSALSKEAALAAASTSTIPFGFTPLSSPSTPASSFLSSLQQQQSPFPSSFSASAPSVAIIAPTPLLPPQQPELAVNTAGTKRRLNAMLLDSPVPLASGSTRRRTRSSRNVVANQNQNNGSDVGQGSEAMDVEEESARERKRVARR